MAADGKTVLANVPGLILVVSVLAGLGVALLAGLVNGFCIAVLGLSPFVTTLGMLSIVRGLAYVVTDGRGSFPGGPGRRLFLRAHRRAMCSACPCRSSICWSSRCHGRGAASQLFGRHVFALGGNEKAAELTGIPVDAGEDRGLCDLRARRGLRRASSSRAGSARRRPTWRPATSSTSSPRRSSAVPTSPAASAVRRAPWSAAC